MTPGDFELGRLLEDLHRARARHREQLRGRLETALAQAARDDMLVALEAYVTALDQHHFPIPPSLKTELGLLRTLSAHRRR